MTVDVDAVNERLSGLVNLLHVVGIDGVDPDALVEEQKRLSKGGDSSGQSSSRAQSSDAQILEIIKKLQQAQADSPEILAALKSPELRALASLAAQKQAPKQPEPAKKAAPSLDDVMDDDDNYPKIGPGYSDDISVVSDLTTPTVMTKQHIAEEEFYKDVNGGPGALPPMHISGGPAQPSRPTHVGGGMGYAPKTKNLVSQVRPGRSRAAIAKSGGAAAQRRLNYQQAMAKLQSNEYGSPAAGGGKQDKNYMEHFSPKKPPTKFFPHSQSPTADPSQFPSIAEQGKKSRGTRNKPAVQSKKKRGTALAAQEIAEEDEDAFEDTAPTAPSTTPGSISSHRKKNTKDKEKNQSQDVGGGGGWGGTDNGWPAFGDTGGGAAGGKSSGDKNVFVDNDGFFPGGAFGGGDPFAATTKPSSARSSSKSSELKKPRDSEGKSRKSKKDSKKGKGSSGRRANLAM